MEIRLLVNVEVVGAANVAAHHAVDTVHALAFVEEAHRVICHAPDQGPFDLQKCDNRERSVFTPLHYVARLGNEVKTEFR